MKNNLAKSTQIRPNKKFNTSIKNFSAAKKNEPIRTSNKMKTSINKPNTNRSNNPPSISGKVRKSVSNTNKKKKSVIAESIQEAKKQSINQKPDLNSVRKNTDKKFKTTIGKKNGVTSSKKNSMSVSLKKDKLGKAKHKSVQLKNVNLFNSGKNKSKSKTAKKKSSQIYDVIDEEEKISSKENQELKNLRNSEIFNKNESLGINIMNHINDEDEIRNIENNIILENENEKNLTEDKQYNNIMNNNINDINKKVSLNQNNLINSPLQNELIKEKISSEFINNNFINANPELALKNKKVETSEHISEKNKNMMKSLLFLLDKKPEDSKNQKNVFRSSINSLEKKEKNKLLDEVYNNRKKIYKMKLANEVKKLDSNQTFNPLNKINSFSNENNPINPVPITPSISFPNNFEDKYQTMKNKYLVMATPSNPKKQYPLFFRDKYFMDYVDGRCPNREILERTMKYERNIYDLKNSGFNSYTNKFNQSYTNKFQFKEKNDLSVEKRDNRYLFYDYGFMINTINDKLNGSITDKYFRESFHSLHKNNSDYGFKKDIRDTNRNQRVSKLYNDINSNIDSIISPEYQLRKTYSERNPFL